MGKMKKIVLCLLFILTFVLPMTACNQSSNGTPSVSEYTVGYYADGESFGTNVVSKSSDILNFVPQKEGYVFKGWYLDDSFTNAYSNQLFSGLMLYGLFEELEQYVVIFDAQGGSYVQASVVYDGDPVYRPSDPYKLNYKFVGWYADLTFTTPWNFADAVNENITLYAKWNRYQVVQAVAELVGSAVVGVGNYLRPDLTNSLGSGVIIKSEPAADGDTYYFALTNYHVVQDAYSVGIYVGDGYKGNYGEFDLLPAEVWSFNEDCDVALVRFKTDRVFGVIESPTINSAGAIPTEIHQGEMVVAVGNPLDFELYRTYTVGHVGLVHEPFSSWYPYIQHDAAINGGNSGGPLFNAYGELIGINAATIVRRYTVSSTTIDVPNEGKSLAIDINYMGEIVYEMFVKGTYDLEPNDGLDSFFFVTRANYNAYQTAYGFPGSYTPAASTNNHIIIFGYDTIMYTGGLKLDDVIVSVNGYAATSMTVINNRLVLGLNTLVVSRYVDGVPTEFTVTANL